MCTCVLLCGGVLKCMISTPNVSDLLSIGLFSGDLPINTLLCFTKFGGP
jgi:hypothetical protein